MVYVSYFTEDAAEHRERNKSKQTWFLLVFVRAMLPLQSVLGVTFLYLQHFNIDCFTLHVLCQRVCVQLPTQLTTWHCSYLLLSARPADVDRYPMAAEPTAANPPLWHAAREEGTGGCTDGRTLDSSIDPAQHAV